MAETAYEFKAGERAVAKIGRNRVEVLVKAKAAAGWTVTTRGGKDIVVKTIEPAGAEAPAAADTKQAGSSKPAETARPASARGLSLVAAAAAVLERSGEPMTVRAIIAEAKESGLWTPSGGKTPEQTLYSAMVREIGDKGESARFRKAGRGLFEFAR